MSIRARKNVGVIGLGIIGQRVADSLRERGFHVFVWNRTPRPVPNFVGSPGEVVELCDFIQIFVSDDEALLQMVQRIARELGPNHIVMVHCTVSPDTMRTAAEIVERRGARLIDAPFTGSKVAADKAQLVYYVGGDEAALRQVRPILEASGKEIIEIGKVGDATTIKVATNMVTAATVQGTAEALALICKSGLPAEKFDQAMQSNGSHSVTLQMKLPMMLAGNFEPHFSVKHMLKDVNIAARLARILDIEVGATEASRRSLQSEMEQGRGDDDYSSVFRQYFASGIPQKKDELSNDLESHPRFAGLDVEEKPPAPEPESLSSAAEVPPPNAPVAAEATGVAQSASSGVAPELQENGAQPVERSAVKVAEEESLPPASVPKTDFEIAAPPAPAKTDQDEVPAGMWGSFWRRHTED